MDNGEYRFRLMREGQDMGYGYILTEMPLDKWGWQNSHHHQGVMETFIVQSGWIAYAELRGGIGLLIKICKPGEMFTSMPGIPHNVYMPAGAVIHTVKHGDCSIKKDWFANPELDELVNHLTEENIRQRAT
jgi:hypothetical protein